jgi:inner membrane protein
VLVPGIFMLWLGLSALLVGVISVAVVWPWQAQFIVFAVFALVAVAWRTPGL